MILHAFGDSFVSGYQDDFIHILGYDPGHGMEFEEREEYLKYNVSFAALIAKHLGFKFKNYAERGSGNFPQLDKLTTRLRAGKIKSGNIVLFGITTPIRDRLFFAEDVKIHNEELSGPILIDRELITSQRLDKVIDSDYFYILCILEQLERIFGIKIIKFNLFGTPPPVPYNFINYINEGTLIDILNDTWGQKIKNQYHTNIDVPAGYENLYTLKKHPSIEGHKKIASWFINNVKL
jgi:hypothetical protein